MTEHLLVNHIKKYLSISEEESAEILAFFDCGTYRKKETLLFAEKRCNKLFWYPLKTKGY